MNDQKKEMGCLLIVVLLFAAPVVLFIDMLLMGFVMYKLWGWFLIPLGLPVIGVIHALGISATMKMFTSGLQYDKEKSDRDRERRKSMSFDQMLAEFFEVIFVKFAACGLVLGFGWVIHYFM